MVHLCVSGVDVCVICGVSIEQEGKVDVAPPSDGAEGGDVSLEGGWGETVQKDAGADVVVVHDIPVSLTHSTENLCRFPALVCTRDCHDDFHREHIEPGALSLDTSASATDGHGTTGK